jgi:hypothetical protein
VAFTGGTAFNGIIDELLELTSRVTHVIPVSDDGGSTAEIVRVLGGPAVGDLRSRCLRLSDESTDEARAVKALLAHRLHATDSAAAKAEWYRIQEGDHELWANISEPYADIIRSFLLYFHSQVSAAKTDVKFDFVNGSVGNFFFAGARHVLPEHGGGDPAVLADQPRARGERGGAQHRARRERARRAGRRAVQREHDPRPE